MKNVHYNKGFSLSELLVVIGVMSLLAGIGIPATKAIMDSVNSSAGLRNMLNAATNNARAMAIKHQKYAGIRFQTDNEGNQYMIYIVSDDAASPTVAELTANPELTGTGLANGFRALKGRKPIKMPGDGRVMDLKIRTNSDARYPDYTDIDSDVEIDSDVKLYDTSTFAIIFSPAGKLVTHQVRIRNHHGKTTNTSTDKIFNT